MWKWEICEREERGGEGERKEESDLLYIRTAWSLYAYLLLLTRDTPVDFAFPSTV